MNASARTILRIVTGFLFAAHGWQKFNEFTIAGTQASFAQMGVPAANVAAPVIATLELVGGIALIVGVLTRVFAALLAVNASQTGDPFTFGYIAMWGDTHALGFHPTPWGDVHTPARGLELVNLYLLRLQTYLFESAAPSLLFATAV